MKISNKNYHLALVFAFIVCLTSCTGEKRKQTDNTQKPKLPEYEVVELEKENDVNKRFYQGNIILKQEEYISTDGIKGILNHVYDSIINSKYSPNVVNIFLFQSKEHSQSGMAQWIGRIYKSKNDISPNIDIEEFKNDQTTVSDAGLNKLSIEVRKEIWNEIVKAEDFSIQKADSKYPTSIRKNLILNSEYQLETEKKLKNDIKLKFEIDDSILEEIANEGLNKNWPFPPLIN